MFSAGFTLRGLYVIFQIIGTVILGFLTLYS